MRTMNSMQKRSFFSLSATFSYLCGWEGHSEENQRLKQNNITKTEAKGMSLSLAFHKVQQCNEVDWPGWGQSEIPLLEIDENSVGLGGNTVYVSSPTVVVRINYHTMLKS